MLVKKLTNFLLFTAFLVGQPSPNLVSKFTTSKTTALTAAAEVLTVQHTATVSKNAAMVSAYGYCSVACTITLERNGTVATTTANTINNVNPAIANASTSTSTAYNTSNVGTGTVLNTYQLAAGSWVSIDLSDIVLPASIADNITLRTNSISGTVQLMFLWVEK